jgi:hypothetical protein
MMSSPLPGLNLRTKHDVREALAYYRPASRKKDKPKFTVGLHLELLRVAKVIRHPGSTFTPASPRVKMYVNKVLVTRRNLFGPLQEGRSICRAGVELHQCALCEF